MFAVIIPLGVIAILTVQLDSLRKINKQRRKNSERLHETYFEQAESLFTVHSLINHETPPLPPSRGWAASPDFLREVSSLIYTEEPRLILEIGSGLSTIISAYCIEQLGEGRVVSLDHEAQYAANTRRQLRRHGVEDRTRVIHASLRSYQLNGGTWEWYSLDEFEENAVDLVIIDGPPAILQERSRYPAVPLLFERLSDDAVLILDDGSRQEEEEIVDQWLEEYPGLEAEFLPLEMGAYVLRNG
ncbi:class I SAM-dependent methyltransferase [Salinibacter ruber]|uniref:O-methyltransferase YrrM n=1 Tax=Salinibacter ruber TaxID=146919 RepID=A0A9X2Q7Y2_9BACT|nr:putative O-methyltransferase YrrM [Salinibacter ruber]